MQGNERRPQQKRPIGSGTKKEAVPLTVTDEHETDSIVDEDGYPEDDSQTYDDDSPRTYNANRAPNLPAARRRDPLAKAYLPPYQNTTQARRAMIPSPQVAQARPVRNVTRQGALRPSTVEKKPRSGMHWLLYVGIGMIAALALWVVGSTALAWGTARYNDLVYGNPRIFQADAVVGHGGDSKLQPSHFIALNLHCQIIVVELMAGNPAKSINYSGPALFDAGCEQIPVTLEFRDVTGDGKVDMLIYIQGQHFVLVNDGTKFRPSNGSDHLQQ